MFAEKPRGTCFFSDREKTYFVAPGDHFPPRNRDWSGAPGGPLVPPSLHPCCTSEPRTADGAHRADAQNDKRDRTPMVQVGHRGYRRPITSPVPTGRVAQRNAHRPTPAGGTTPKCSFLIIWGGRGYRYPLRFWRFLDPSADAASFCPTWSTFGHKIFFAQTVVSSRSSSSEVD